MHRLLDSRVERTSVFPSIPSFPCFHPDIPRMAEGEKQRWAKGRVERHVVDVNAELFNRRRSVYLLRDDSQGTRIVPSSFPTRLFQLCDIVTLERSLRISYRYLYLSNVQELIWSSRCKHNHPISIIRIIDIAWSTLYYIYMYILIGKDKFFKSN